MIWWYMYRLATEFKPILAPALDATGYHEEKKETSICYAEIKEKYIQYIDIYIDL